MPYFTQNYSPLDLKTLFPFPLDEFQHQAIEALDAGKSVVVCSPTGSGKTLIGEYAIYRALTRGKRVFYTTPLKALSNQKLRDFREQFGPDNVGLVTGDLSVNREAPILVMTTEIFRNMLYGTPIGEIGTSLIDVEAVVLDECHYMNDRQRGTVWEESIIYCPRDVQLVALSATVANSQQLTDWIHTVHGPTELIYSDFRPVPLQYYFCNPKGFFPLLDDKHKRINQRLISKRTRERGRIEVPNISDVVSHLQERDLLPAIYFIFSRRGCDRALTTIENLSLVNEAEAAEIKKWVDEFLQKNPEVGRSHQIEPIYRGVASHHAGILPAWKGLIEELFQKGLIKVVFATETLAAGINMPARTTVISSLSKRTDDGHRLLRPSEFLQMAGRAGRRGMDLMGNVVTVQTPFEGAKEASYLATSGADPLVSQFTPSYGMVLNLLQTHTIEEAKELVERSFGQYFSTLSLRPEREAIENLKTELTNLEKEFASYEGDLNSLEKQLHNYEKLKERIKEEKRLLKLLQRQAEDVLAKEMANALTFAEIGTIVSLKGKHVPTARRADSHPVAAILFAKVPGSGQAPHFLCLGRDNRWYLVATADVVGLHAELPHLVEVQTFTIPGDLNLKLGQCRRGDENSEPLVQKIPTLSAIETAPELLEQQRRVELVETQLAEHPLTKWGNPTNLLKRWRHLDELREEISDREAELESKLARHWEEFVYLIGVLQNFGGLDELQPTALGQACAAIRGDNELWLGLALMSGVLDDLDPHHIAAAAAALVTEVTRPDSWTSYILSPQVDQALAALMGLRRQLFQVQRRYHVNQPIWLERELIALVEHWALGGEWLELVAHTSLDEGDVVRMLRRTLDFLSQIPHVPHLPQSLRMNAIRAMTLIDRFPVNEVAD